MIAERAAPSPAAQPANHSRATQRDATPPWYTRPVSRAFVVAWIALGIAGALNQTVAPALAGRSFDLLLPHLKYGHVMFNKNAHQAAVFSYLAPDGARRDLAELAGTPALGYRRARLAITLATKPDYLAELCLHAERAGRGELTFVIDEYDDRDRPPVTHRLRCGAHGLHEQ